MGPGVLAAPFFPGTDWMHCEDEIKRKTNGSWAGFYCQATLHHVYFFCPAQADVDRLSPCRPAKRGVDSDPAACCNRAREGVVDFTLKWDTQTLCIDNNTLLVMRSNTTCDTKWQFVQGRLFANGVSVRWNSTSNEMFVALGTHQNSGLLLTDGNVDAPGDQHSCSLSGYYQIQLYHAGVGHVPETVFDSAPGPFIVSRGNASTRAAALSITCLANDFFFDSHVALCLTREPGQHHELTLRKRDVNCEIHTDSAHFAINPRTKRLESPNGVPLCWSLTSVSRFSPFCDDITKEIYMSSVEGQDDATLWYFFARSHTNSVIHLVAIISHDYNLYFIPQRVPRYTYASIIKSSLNHTWFWMNLIQDDPHDKIGANETSAVYTLQRDTVNVAPVSMPTLVWADNTDHLTQPLCANDNAGIDTVDFIFQKKGCAWWYLGQNDNLCATSYNLAIPTEDSVPECLWQPRASDDFTVVGDYPMPTFCHTTVSHFFTAPVCVTLIGFAVPTRACLDRAAAFEHLSNDTRFIIPGVDRAVTLAWCPKISKTNPYNKIPKSAYETLNVPGSCHTTANEHGYVKWGGSHSISHFYVDPHNVKHNVNNVSICIP